MFYFGSPEDQASIYWDEALGALGPEMPGVHLDEMSTQDVRNALAYSRMAYNRAVRDGAPADTIEVLVARHDAVFAHLCSIDDDFRGRVLGEKPGKKPVWLGGYAPENIEKYLNLASAN